MLWKRPRGTTALSRSLRSHLPGRSSVLSPARPTPPSTGRPRLRLCSILPLSVSPSTSRSSRSPIWCVQKLGEGPKKGSAFYPPALMPLRTWIKSSHILLRSVAARQLKTAITFYSLLNSPAQIKLQNSPVLLLPK